MEELAGLEGSLWKRLREGLLQLKTLHSIIYFELEVRPYQCAGRIQPEGSEPAAVFSTLKLTNPWAIP